MCLEECLGKKKRMPGMWACGKAGEGGLDREEVRQRRGGVGESGHVWSQPERSGSQSCSRGQGSHHMQERDARPKSLDLGQQCRAQEACRQGRRVMSAMLGPLFWEDCSGGPGSGGREPK